MALWGAIDPKDGIVYIYREHYEAGKSVAYHAEKMMEHNRTIPYGLLRQPLGDPKGKARSEKDMMSTFDHYAEYGVYFRPGINKIEDGIYKVFTYFELGRLKIFSNLKHTIDEFQKYKYPPRKMGEDEKVTEKPLDKDNHCMDSLKYLICDLPDNPFDLVNESYRYTHEALATQKHLPYELQEEDNYNDVEEWQAYY